jgi:peptide/nickel transport system permease protein
MWIALHIPVSDVLYQKLGNTLILAAAALFLSVLWGVPAGVISAARQYSVFDRAAMFTALILASAPVFWLGLVLMYIFAVELRVLPALGMYDIRNAGQFLDLLQHLILPAVTTAAIPMAVIARLTRTNMLDVLRQDYVVALKAKGMRQRSIYRHALRNAMPQIVNITALQGGFLMASTIFTEVVFSWPGLGLQLYSSIVARDLPMIQAAVIVIALVFVVLNMISDVVCHMIDPRQRMGTEASV